MKREQIYFNDKPSKHKQILVGAYNIDTTSAQRRQINVGPTSTNIFVLRGPPFNLQGGGAGVFVFISR